MNSSSGVQKRSVRTFAMAGMILIFIAYMFPFLMVVINSLKQKRDIIKSPFSWLFTVKGLSFDNFAKAFNQMDFLNAIKNSLIITVSATAIVTILAAMLAYFIVRNNNLLTRIIFALMVASMIIPFQAIMIPLVSIYGGTLNLLNHRLTLIFMHVGFSMSMTVFMFHGYKGQRANCIGGGSISRRMYTHSDIFQDRVPIAEADHVYHIDFECPCVLERFPASVTGFDRQKAFNITFIHL